MNTNKDNINLLVIKYLSDNASEDERQLVEAWINKSAENRQRFDEASFLWQSLGAGRKLSKKEKADDWTSILERIEKSGDFESILKLPLLPASEKIVSLRSRRILRSFFRIAAVFIFAFFLSWAGLYYLILKPNSRIPAYNEIITSKGQKSQIILSDGTKIWLNSETSLKYPASFHEDQREVFLEGEAFFEVQKKENKAPFLVKTSEMDIEVLGTKFNVMAYADEETVETTLVEGSIDVIRRGPKPSKDRHVLLEPNQKITLIKKGSQAVLSDLENRKPTMLKNGKGSSTSPSKHAQLLVSSKVDTELHTAWKDDRLIFQSETLENIASKLERWYDVRIHIQDEELKQYRYTGEFAHKETLIQVMEILNLTTPIEFTFEKNDVYIKKMKRK